MHILLPAFVLLLSTILASVCAGEPPHRPTPNDPLLSEQWYLFSADDEFGSAGSINAIEAWGHIKPAPPIIVAVLDIGVNSSHPDLGANIWKNDNEVANGKDDDGNGYIDDFHGWDFALDGNDSRSRVSDDDLIPFDHGTAVAGLIAAVPDNDIGIAGVGRNVEIMPLRILGNGANLDSTFPRAVSYAIHNGARVLIFTALFALPPEKSMPAERRNALEPSLKEAEAQGVLVVLAAGNQGSSIDEDMNFQFFAQFSNVLIVGGTDRNGELSPKMNFGKLVGLAAPSVDMTFPSFDGYKRFKGPGTSFAAPIVAAMAATLLSQHPELSPQETIARLKDASVVTPAMREVIGGGRLDMAKLFGPEVPIRGGVHD